MMTMAFHLTFGGAPCPPLWNVISESGTGIANKLIQFPNWDHSILFDPLFSTLEELETIPPEISFAQSKELTVDVPINDIGKCELYIDDTMTVALGKDDIVRRVASAVPLAIHTIA